MKIDCATCEMYRTAHCADCLVTAVLHPPNDLAEIDDDISESLEGLAAAGLIPVLRFRPRKIDREDDEEIRSGEFTKDEGINFG